MWVSFPISRHMRIILPWFVAVLFIPIAAGLWVVGLTVDVIRWVWRRPAKHDTPQRVIRIRLSS